MTKLILLGNFLKMFGFVIILCVCSALVLQFLFLQIFYNVYNSYDSLIGLALIATPLFIGIPLYILGRIILGNIDDDSRIGSKELDPNIGEIQIKVRKAENSLIKNGILEIKPKSK